MMSQAALSFHIVKHIIIMQRRPFDEARLFCLRPAFSAPGRDSLTSEVDGPEAPAKACRLVETAAWGAKMAVGTVKFFNTA
jgi:hypothetical protein